MPAVDVTHDGSGGRFSTPARVKLAILSLTLLVGSSVGTAAVVFRSDGNHLAGLDNPAGLSTFTAEQDSSFATIDSYGSGPYGPFTDDAFSETITPVDNGYNGDGNFRIQCAVSHFAYDDPILKPGKPGSTHLHMFWGNTFAGANTFNSGVETPGDKRNLIERGSSTCQGGAVNRSAYWMPAMLDGAGAGRKIVMPKAITLYYKSKHPEDVQVLPLGIQLLVGNVNPGGTVNSSFTPGERLSWGCYNGWFGIAVGPGDGDGDGTPDAYEQDFAKLTAPRPATIPGKNGTDACPASTGNGSGDIQASIQFPQCIATDNGLATGTPDLTNADFVSHTHMLYNFGGNYGTQNSDCPSTHPYRVPQISYLVRWANPAATATAGWRLSSDAGHNNATGSVPNPGGSLHGDWLGGWHPGAIQAWIDGCFDPGPVEGVNNFGGPRNCSLGQTGPNGTGRRFDPITGTNLSAQLYTGPQLLDDPEPGYVLIP